jgi:hypothetical protein
MGSRVSVFRGRKTVGLESQAANNVLSLSVSDAVQGQVFQGLVKANEPSVNEAGRGGHELAPDESAHHDVVIDILSGRCPGGPRYHEDRR